MCWAPPRVHPPEPCRTASKLASTLKRSRAGQRCSRVQCAMRLVPPPDRDCCAAPPRSAPGALSSGTVTTTRQVCRGLDENALRRAIRGRGARRQPANRKQPLTGGASGRSKLGPTAQPDISIAVHSIRYDLARLRTRPSPATDQHGFGGDRRVATGMTTDPNTTQHPDGVHRRSPLCRVR